MEPPENLPLTDPERCMWDAVAADRPCIFGDDDPRQLASADEWGPERTVRGHVLAALLICAEQAEPRKSGKSKSRARA